MLLKNPRSLQELKQENRINLKMHLHKIEACSESIAWVCTEGFFNPFDFSKRKRENHKPLHVRNSISLIFSTSRQCDPTRSLWSSDQQAKSKWYCLSKPGACPGGAGWVTGHHQLYSTLLCLAVLLLLCRIWCCVHGSRTCLDPGQAGSIKKCQLTVKWADGNASKAEQSRAGGNKPY